MQAITTSITPRTKVPLKSIAVPVEHGSWGFVAEPLAAGLFLAPSWSAIFISVFVIGAFLCRQPLKFLLADWQQGRRLPRTEVALRFVLIFGAIAAFGLIGSVIFAPPTSFIPFVLVAPAVVYLIVQDAARQTRNLLPELIAVAALSSSLPVLVLASGLTWPLAIALWIVMSARLIPSIIYVRNRLRLEKGKEFSRSIPITAHILALFVVGALAFVGLSPYMMIPAMGLLLMRAVLGLSNFRRTTTRAKVIGVGEIVYGVVTVACLIVGYHVGF